MIYVVHAENFRYFHNDTYVHNVEGWHTRIKGIMQGSGEHGFGGISRQRGSKEHIRDRGQTMGGGGWCLFGGVMPTLGHGQGEFPPVVPNPPLAPLSTT